MASRTGRVLVADDDINTRRSLERGLRLGGFEVILAEDGRAAMESLGRTPPDVVVLDVCMPGLSGIEVCRRLRESGDEVPILMLSGLDEVADRIAGLEAGGDDYLVKPFALQELKLRLQALLRRRPPVVTDRIEVGALTVDPSVHQASLDGQPLHLTPREFHLLETLARNAGIVLSRDQLLEHVWGYDARVRTDAVDTFISYLRRKTEAHGHPRVLHTVRGLGFVLRMDRSVQKGGTTS
ncbi:response regulator transcription factor [Streptomyces sp. BH-SS-21]|uniref:Response regulator transcription factor n=1 Tax=Streptomyces liliiviolaceus TaxID=2823109 RepID=A0A941B6K4_9ACTN|nr:response regulator transcription factor [Streptomyces liliiviolaceus]MBQ0849431.1 response regulator transcription factor [Streptomyces liliiviolaceus]